MVPVSVFGLHVQKTRALVISSFTSLVNIQHLVVAPEAASPTVRRPAFDLFLLCNFLRRANRQF